MLPVKRQSVVHSQLTGTKFGPGWLCRTAERCAIHGFTTVDQLADGIVLPPLLAIVDASGDFAQQAEAEELKCRERAKYGQ